MQLLLSYCEPDVRNFFKPPQADRKNRVAYITKSGTNNCW